MKMDIRIGILLTIIVCLFLFSLLPIWIYIKYTFVYRCYSKLKYGDWFYLDEIL